MINQIHPDNFVLTAVHFFKKMHFVKCWLTVFAAANLDCVTDFEKGVIITAAELIREDTTLMKGSGSKNCILPGRIHQTHRAMNYYHLIL